MSSIPNIPYFPYPRALDHYLVFYEITEETNDARVTDWLSRSYERLTKYFMLGTFRSLFPAISEVAIFKAWLFHIVYARRRVCEETLRLHPLFPIWAHYIPLPPELAALSEEERLKELRTNSTAHRAFQQWEEEFFSWFKAEYPQLGSGFEVPAFFFAYFVAQLDKTDFQLRNALYSERSFWFVMKSEGMKKEEEAFKAALNEMVIDPKKLPPEVYIRAFSAFLRKKAPKNAGLLIVTHEEEDKQGSFNELCDMYGQTPTESGLHAWLAARRAFPNVNPALVTPSMLQGYRESCFLPPLWALFLKEVDKHYTSHPEEMSAYWTWLNRNRAFYYRKMCVPANERSFQRWMISSDRAKTPELSAFIRAGAKE